MRDARVVALEERNVRAFEPLSGGVQVLVDLIEGVDRHHQDR